MKIMMMSVAGVLFALVLVAALFVAADGRRNAPSRICRLAGPLRPQHSSTLLA